MNIHEHIKDLPQNVQEALSFLIDYGQTDGAHHKTWVIDQAVRALVGEKYDAVIAAYCDGEDGADTYEWDEGIAP